MLPVSFVVVDEAGPILVALLLPKSEFDDATLTRRDLREADELDDEGEVAMGELRVRSNSLDEGEMR